MIGVSYDAVHAVVTQWRRTLLLFVMSTVVVTGLSACRDLLTTPVRNIATPNVSTRPAFSFSEDDGYGEFDSPSSGSYDGVISEWDASAPPTEGWDFPLPTIVSVVASGDVHQVPGLLHGDDLVWGPTGAGGQLLWRCSLTEGPSTLAPLRLRS
jgi:hypothetical protein